MSEQTQQPTAAPSAGRMAWLDAMRGFTMLLVVANHVAGKSFGLLPKYSSTLEVLTLFRMPMFFFVSGFLAYKATTVWTGRTLGESLKKKARVQIVPAAVFLVACAMYTHKDWWEYLVAALQDCYKGGYWFTWILLQMFVVYYLFAWFEQRLLAWRRNLPMTIAVYALLATITMTFRRYNDIFSRKTVAGRAMQYIGTRTLDIYLLHYFFLPTLPMVGPWLKQYRPNVVIETALSVGMAIAIVALCCLASAVLRTSPILKKYLFGKE